MARRSILSQLFRQSAGYVLQFKEFELYWGAVFLRLEEQYWRSPFFKSILLEWILKQEMKNVKKFGSDFVAEQNQELREWRFVHIAVF